MECYSLLRKLKKDKSYVRIKYNCDKINQTTVWWCLSEITNWISHWTMYEIHCLESYSHIIKWNIHQNNVRKYVIFVTIVNKTCGKELWYWPAWVYTLHLYIHTHTHTHIHTHTHTHTHIDSLLNKFDKLLHPGHITQDIADLPQQLAACLLSQSWTQSPTCTHHTGVLGRQGQAHS